MTIGDVLAVIALIFVVVGSCVAAMLVACMTFPVKVQTARSMTTSSPAACGFRGFLIIFIGTILAIVSASAHFGGGKLLALLYLRNHLFEWPF